MTSGISKLVIKEQKQVSYKVFKVQIKYKF